MLEIPECLDKVFRNAAEKLKGCDEIRVLAHYDADGISSAAIVYRALKGKRFHISFVKDLSRENIKNMMDQNYQCYLFVDMGSSLIDLLSSYKNVIVLDHHPVVGEGDIIHINPHLCGMDGSRDACGATLSYLLSIHIDEKNVSLYPIYLAGVIGDKQDIGGYTGLNRIIYENILKNSDKISDLKMDGHNVKDMIVNSVEPFFLDLTGKEENVEKFLRDANINGEMRFIDLKDDEKVRLVSLLTLRLLKLNIDPEYVKDIVTEKIFLRDFGLYDRNLSNIVNACARMEKQGLAFLFLSGDNGKRDEVLEIFKKYRNNVINEVYSAISGRKELKSIVYFYVEGDSMAGAVSGIMSSYVFDKRRPVLALHVKNSEVRVSARTTRYMVSRGLNMGEILKNCSEKVGGFGGGHNVAAGANIPEEKEKEFIQCVDESVGKMVS